MDHNMVFTYNFKKKGGGKKQVHLHCGPFRWLCERVGAIQTASPNAACPGLSQKSLDATIGQLLSLYCPGGNQGDSKQNNDEKMH
jgi:hypothetical protein